MAAEQLTEQVAEGLEEAAEVARDVTNKEMAIFFYGLGIGVAAGFAIGWFVNEKRLEKKYTKLIENEIEEMREHFHQRATAAQVPDKPPIDKVVKDLKYTEKEVEAIEEVEMEVDEEVELSEWDYAYEMKKRQNLDKPYVIHVDEYIENEGEYEQTTYTYFEADDMMVDVRDNPVDLVAELVGLDNLQLFGHGSNDPSIVYVRNDEKNLDMEISRSPGSYAEEVHGVIEHSEGKKKRRHERRFDDD